MRISPAWLREFVDIKVSDRQLADDLTLAGIAVESIKTDLAPQPLLFEMEIGTNRPDAMCHYGVARECSAIYDTALKAINPHLPKPKAARPFPIAIEDKGCLRYTARVIRNVKIAPSPANIVERLRIDDHGGVSNAVDASNYTLMELGHPTHAFDLDKLEGGKIIVRRARAGETLTTLDGVERKLDPQDLIIADARKPVGLAGVMGGLDSAISSSTKNILIESAWFDPAAVRRTSRRLGMHTDASHIFERGADWSNTTLACDRVAELILSSAGGELEGEPVDVIAGHVVRYSVWLRRKEISRILGLEIDTKTVTRILRRLGFKLGSIQESFSRDVKVIVSPEALEKVRARARERGITLPEWNVDADQDIIVDLPTWRLDVEREIDLIEEIARIYGYNKFSNTLPSFSGGVIELPNADKQAKVRSVLLALGYNEAISPTFISPADAGAFSGAVMVPLANPLSDEQSVMRTSLAPGMLAMIAWNLNRGTSDVRLFEMGHIFYAPTEEAAKESLILSIGATGNAVEAGVHGPARAYSFFDLKGDIENLLAAFEITGLRFEPAERFHPGRGARAVADGAVVAEFGQLHPEIAASRKLKQDVFIAEVYLDRLFMLPLRAGRYQPLSKYPAVDRDFSFVFPDGVIFERIESEVHALNIAELCGFKPVEIFRGGAVPAGRYSLLLRAEFQSEERTLRDDEVAGWSAQIIGALEKLGGSLRS
ncbi:MAG TPA: phenylalanine--tRNA ligase subunit beta [Candidatus Angelobacter sp.]|nr:phenylalanine--tRNA ligase subunit beta [Candidatus Angelobacter sp.]